MKRIRTKKKIIAFVMAVALALSNIYYAFDNQPYIHASEIS